MANRTYKYNYVGKLSECLKKIENSKWYMAYQQELFLRDIEEKEPDIRKMLKENKALKNLHQGERCFVLGNGSSLNNIDFKKLSNEIVFTVNQLPRHPRFQELQSNYHLITDLQAFGLRYDKDKLTPGFTEYSLQSMKSLATKGGPILIVPYQVKRILRRARITDLLEIRYICPYRSFNSGYHNCDLATPISGFTGVVLTAVLCAVYMGFSEIYLLGCEQTAIIDTLECALGNRTKYGHAYADQQLMEENGYRILADSRGVTTLLRGEVERHEAYEQIYAYCRERGVRLYNLTVPTLIDSIPKRNFDKVIQKTELRGKKVYGSVGGRKRKISFNG